MMDQDGIKITFFSQKVMFLKSILRSTLQVMSYASLFINLEIEISDYLGVLEADFKSLLEFGTLWRGLQK